MEKFGLRLKTLRTELGLTQKELGRKLGINYTTVSDYERGDKTDPYISTIRLFANYFDVSLEYLTGDSDIRWNFGKLKEIIAHLSDENKNKVYSYAEFLRREQDAKDNLPKE